MRQWLERFEQRHGIDLLTLRARQCVLASFGLLLLMMLLYILHTVLVLLAVKI